MLRQIITPTQRQITLEIPESYLNQAIEIIAFRMNEPEQPQPTKTVDLSLFKTHRGCYEGGFAREDCYDR
jgi:hypothetical protein